MPQQSSLLTINVTINLEVDVADMTKNSLENNILHTKSSLRHASNPLNYDCVTGNKK